MAALKAENSQLNAGSETKCSVQLGILGLQGSHVLRRSLLLGPRLLRSLLLLLLVLLPAKRGHLRTWLP